MNERKEQWRRREPKEGFLVTFMDREVLVLEPVSKVREAEGFCTRVSLVESHGEQDATDIDAITVFFKSSVVIFKQTQLRRDEAVPLINSS
uniref:Uncharacterized protein n=1 Tax=Cannabis sativa TaxID=3483 RepID=A0A803QCY6_CANSA